MIEFECTLECNFNCDYCTNGRNAVLKNKIDESSWDKIKIFLETKIIPTNEELFIFGGEPFLSKNFLKITELLNHCNHPYLVQTNFSLIDKIEKKLTEQNIPRNIEISIHSQEIKSLDFYIKYIDKYNNIVKGIDVMYEGDESLKKYFILSKYFKNKVLLVPIGDFKTSSRKYLPLLKKYNQMKRTMKSIIRFEEGNRSELWEKEFLGEISVKGKSCQYYNRYRLFSPNLDEYNCSHRMNTKICPNDTCFFMQEPIIL